jgi:rod shape-determining protein MreD
MVLFGSVPVHLPGISLIITSFSIINIFYWCVFYPESLPYWFLFLLGILQDSLVGKPIGLSSFLYIIFALILMSKHRILSKNSFSAVWLGFIMYSGVITVLEWVVMSLYSGRALPIKELSIGWCLACLAYPIMHFFLSRIYRLHHE